MSDLGANPNNDSDIGSTMRVLRRISRSSEAREERPQPHRVRGRARRRRPPRGRRRRPRSRRCRSGLAQGLDRLDRRAAGGDDVLDEADALALGSNDAFEPVGGAVALRLLADDQERQPACERRRGRERHRAELGRREPHGVRLVLGDRGRDRLAERARAGRGASRSGTCRGSTELRCPSGARSRLRGRRPRGARRRARPRSSRGAGRSCASGSRRSASGEPSANESHRAVLGVEVDALAPARGAAA